MTRTLTTGGAVHRGDTVCPHLAPALQYLVSNGSRVIEVHRMAWSLIDLDIVLDRAPDPRSLPDALAAMTGVTTWVNFDTHYPLAHGLACAGCRPALSWSHDRDPADA